MEIKLVLCPIDFSDFSVKAFRYALSLAEHYQAKLVAQHVVEIWRYPSAGFAAYVDLYDEFCQSMREKAKMRLQEFVKNHTHNGIQSELLVDQGMAPDSILSFAQTQKADLIVMGTHGRRGYDRLMLGSVTDRVMRRAPCPVLAISKLFQDSILTAKEQTHSHFLSRVLFCADFSKNSERALDYAISATEEYGSELTLLHVLEEAPIPAKTEEAITVATKQLEKLIPLERRAPLKIKTAVRVGKPYQQIIELALDAQIDMVTMGVHGYGALDPAVFGSTTYRVIQLGPCPVLVVHAEPL